MIETEFTRALAKRLPELTKPQRRLGAYVLEHPFKVAIMSIDEFAQAAGVSSASANRFARALGYPGYAQFRQNIIKGFEGVLESVNRLKKEQSYPASNQEIMSNVLVEGQRNLEKTRLNLNAETCDKAVDMILAARRIFILGLGTSGYLAGLLERRLFAHNDMVVSLAGPGGSTYAARRLALVDEQDLVIALTFPRYLADTVRIVQKAHSRGASVLGLTDKATSPVVPHCDCILYISSDSIYDTNSDPVALALIDALMAALDYRSPFSVEIATEVAETITPWLIHGETSA
ncbi:hypothetical protein CAP48_05080 [Advenella sp. S44]|uniref:MurR/RpiR family transcriptional regulator n=1 Tax=Advenella sp. S44 TaxID=1982755 RepID=UPI000C29F006|nr:MurR/RpiR family transcriptional regulator [Advenella sp. S44]PJX25427.1 hypothetical protein CAP48_05080 [Advenella sp. S44]